MKIIDYVLAYGSQHQCEACERSRRARRLSILITAVVSVVVVAMCCTAAAALWQMQQVTPGLSEARSITGFSVQRDGEQDDVAKGPDDSVGFTVTADDAKSLVVSGDYMVAIPFTVHMMTSGGWGMSFNIALEPAESGQFLEGAKFWSFFTTEPAGCSVESAKGTSLNMRANEFTGVPVPTDGNVRPPATVTTANLCLVIERQPSGQYENQAWAKGADPDGKTVESNPDTWQADTGPDPALQDDLSVTLTHTNIKYGTA